MQIFRYLCGRVLEIDGDIFPFTSKEDQYAQSTTHNVACEDSEPDLYRFESGNACDHEAYSERNRDLRDDRDIERAFCIAASL